MPNRLTALGFDNSSAHKFIAYDASGQVWNGSAFETWDDANFSTYGIAATGVGTTTRYKGDEPTGTVLYELWVWTGVLDTSIVADGDRLGVDVVSVAGTAASLASGLPTNEQLDDILRVVQADDD
jgi:hypothetical protein